MQLWKVGDILPLRYQPQKQKNKSILGENLTVMPNYLIDMNVMCNVLIAMR